MSDLCAVKIFGVNLDWTVSTTVLVLMLAQIALVAVAVVAFILITVRKHALSKRKQNILVTHAAEPDKDRSIVGISLDTVVVKRKFTVGEAFDYSGLIVTASYNSEPSTENVIDFTVETPDMDRPGKPTVVVHYGGFSAYYTIEVVATSEERTCVGISLDVTAVRRLFAAGEAFDCGGLVVTANYNGAPLTENVVDFTVETPDMSFPGSRNVLVRYGGFSAYYTIEIAANAEQRTCVGISLDVTAVRKQFAEGEPFDCAGLVVVAHYDREPLAEEVFDYTVESPATDEAGVKQVVVRHGDFVEYYNIEVTPVCKERTLVGIDLDLEAVRADFFVGETFDCAGLGVVARYDAEPYAERVTDFTVEAPDLTEKGMKNVVVRYGDFVQTYPVFVAEERALVGITLDTSVVRREFATGETFNAVGLIVTADYDAEPYSEELSDYEVEAPDLSEEGEKEVRVSYLGKTASYSVTVVRPAETAEETAAVALDESLIRYDKSFTARLIQTSDENKRWYTLIKNELLSYKKVHDRMSWKRETYKAAGGCVAKISFRGNTLCLFLPLDPAEFVESRYKVEDDSVNKSSEDTPCLFRIKNDKRLRLSFDLIARVMEERGLARVDHEEVDYAEPYQDTEALIEKGLVRRKVTTKEEEDAVFTRK